MTRGVAGFLYLPCPRRVSGLAQTARFAPGGVVLRTTGHL
jgi:hypothetical protein